MNKTRFIDWLYTCAVCALLLAPVFVQAQALPAGVSPVYAPTVQGNAYTYTTGTATAANASTVAFPPPANGPVYTTTTQSQPLGSGMSANVVVKSRPSAAVIAKAVGNFAGKVVGVIAVGKALYDLCNELGFNCSRTAQTGPITITKPDPNICSVAPCSGFQFVSQFGFTTPWASTVSGACSAYRTAFTEWATIRGSTAVVTSCVPYKFANGAYPDTVYAQTSNGGGDLANTRAETPKPAVSNPSTMTELEAAIAAKSGWPSTSAITRALPEAIASGVPLELPTPYEITGPASLPMAPSVTTFPDGSKVTDTPQKNISYGPNTVTVTDTSTKTNTSPTGVVSPVSTVTTAPTLPAPSPAVDKPKDPCGLPDTPKCAIDGAGTPTAEELPNDQAEKSLDPVKDFLKDPYTVIPKLPTINWAFSLPTACGVIPTPAFDPYVKGIDVCQFQSMFHEIMGMVWMLGGLFGAISLFMRSSLAD